MALVSSGEISIGGTTSGRSVELELGMSGTATASLNDTNFRSLAGITGSGTTISLYDFYGKSSVRADGTTALFYGGNTQTTNYMNTLLRVDSNGTQIGSETSVGTGRGYIAGATIGTVGIFYGGIQGAPLYAWVAIATRLDKNGTLLSTENSTGNLLSGTAGAGVGGTTAMYIYGGSVLRLNSTGATVGTVTAAFYGGMYQRAVAGGDVAMVFGGYVDDGKGNVTYYNNFEVINSNGTLISHTLTTATARGDSVGAGINGAGLFFGGLSAASYNNIVSLFNSNGTLMASETNVGTARWGGIRTGSAVINGPTAILFGGSSISTTLPINTTTRFNSSGGLIGSETSIGTARTNVGGTGL